MGSNANVTITFNIGVYSGKPAYIDAEIKLLETFKEWRVPSDRELKVMPLGSCYFKTRYRDDIDFCVEEYMLSSCGLNHLHALKQIK